MNLISQVFIDERSLLFAHVVSLTQRLETCILATENLQLTPGNH